MNFFKDRDILLVTIHQKEKVIKPLLEREFGCNIHVSKLDTDQFGTFTRKISRQQSQFDTARKKVTMGMKLTNHHAGVASEGTFGFHPFAPIPWNTELVLLKDDELGLELHGYYEGLDTNFRHQIVQDYLSALQFANEIGFPDHHVILRADDEHSSVMLKDITNESLLQEAFNYCFNKSTNRQVFIETDMRAYANPTRMKNIETATRQLIEQANSLCPTCGTPGFRVVRKVPGRLCEQCHAPTKQIVQHVYACSTCQHQQTEYLGDMYTSPRYCDFCNP